MCIHASTNTTTSTTTLHHLPPLPPPTSTCQYEPINTQSMMYLAGCLQYWLLVQTSTNDPGQVFDGLWQYTA